MGYYDKAIPGDPSFKSSVAEGLIEATFSTQEHFSQYQTECGKDQYVWNPRYKNIVALLPSERFVSKVFTKNRWKYMAILDLSINCLFLLLNRNRFRDILYHPGKNKMHYARSPAKINDDLDKFDTIDEQMRIRGWTDNILGNDVVSFHCGELAKMQAEFEQNFDRYVVITFKPCAERGISSLSANLVDSQFNLKKTESWDAHIPVMVPVEPVINSSQVPVEGTLVLNNVNRVDGKPIPKLLPKEKSKSE